MADDDIYDDDDVEFDDEAKPERTHAEWAELRRAKKARDKAEKELEAMKREMAFAKAGIDINDPQARYFVKGYEGEITPEAIRAEAVSAGFLAELPPEEPDLDAVDAQQRMAAASGGIGPDQPDLAISALDQAFAEGGTDGMLQHLEELGVPINYAQ